MEINTINNINATNKYSSFLKLSSFTTFILSIIFVTKPLWDLLWTFEALIQFSPQQLVVLVMIYVSMLYILILVLFEKHIYLVYKKLLLVIFVVCFLSFLIQPSVSGLDMLTRQLSAFLFFIVFVNVFAKYPDVFVKIGRCYLCVLIIPSLICYLQLMGILPFTYYDSILGIGLIPRATGGYLQPTGFTSYLLISYLIATYLLMSRQLKGVLFLLYIGLTLPALVSTLHRTSILLALLIFSQIIICYKTKYVKFLFVIAFLVLLMVSYEKLSILMTSGGYTTADDILHSRPLIWLSYLEYFFSLPFYHQTIGVATLAGIPVLHLPDGVIDNDAHNEYVRTLVCYGYLGFIAVSGFFTALAVLGARKLRHYSRLSDITKPVAVLFVTTLLFAFIYGITLETLRYSNMSWGLFLILAFCVVRLSGARKVIIK